MHGWLLAKAGIRTAIRDLHAKKISKKNPGKSIMCIKPRPALKSNAQKTLPPTPVPSPKRYTGVCIFWDASKGYGFFRELLSGWHCFGHFRDTLRETDTAPSIRLHDIVEFAINMVKDSKSTKTGGGRPGSPSRFNERLRAICITRMGGLPFD